MFTPTWRNDPILLVFFRWVETTNQNILDSLPVMYFLLSSFLNFQMQKVVHRYVKILQILSQCSQSQQRAWQYQELRAETERLKAADVAATLLLSEKEEALSHWQKCVVQIPGSILIYFNRVVCMNQSPG